MGHWFITTPPAHVLDRRLVVWSSSQARPPVVAATWTSETGWLPLELA
jgi:hypothetical protein